MGRSAPVVTAAVEGLLDEAVVRRLVLDSGGSLGAVHVKHGNQPLRAKVAGYNLAAQRAPWLVLTDLDRAYSCPAALVAAWLAERSDGMQPRVAVQSVEAWLLADRERFARFLVVPVSRVPEHAEQLPNPKATVIDLARQSRRRDIRTELVPTSGGGRSVGPGYVGRLFEFVHSHWVPAHAAQRSESLDRCRRRLAEMCRC